jgi:RsiW-degrading membrane proteinase PrsW (M82 family)
MSILRGKQVPVTIMLVTGVIVILGYFLDISIVTAASSELQTWSVVISTFAMGLGFINLLGFHIPRVQKRKEREWWLSLVLLIMLAATLVTGFMSPWADHPYFSYIFQTVNKPLGGSMYAILAFFITSAIYRAFRARNLDATLLLVAGLFTLLQKAPIGGAIWPGFNDIGTWFLKVPNSAGMRGIIIGAALGVIALGIRTLMGAERRGLGLGE